MEKAGGGISARNLDTRLLRFRHEPESEPGASLAAELLQAGRCREALEVALVALGPEPEHPRLHLIEGQAWLREGDLIRAQSALLKAARYAPHEKEPFRWLGEVLLKRGDPQRATKVLERAVAIDPQDRAVQLLYQRAERFSRIAASDGEGPAAAASRKAFDRQEEPEEEESTLVARDLSERLAVETLDTTRTDAVVASSPAGVDRLASVPFDDEDEAPTTVADRAELLDAVMQGRPPVADPLDAVPTRAVGADPPQRRHKRTMLGLGAEAAAVPSPPAARMPLPERHPIPAAPPPAPAPPRRAKRTVLGLGAEEAPAVARPLRPEPPMPAVDFGTDPFGRDPFGDVTTNPEPIASRREPERRAPRPAEPSATDLRARAMQPPMPLAPPPAPRMPPLAPRRDAPVADPDSWSDAGSLDSLSQDLPSADVLDDSLDSLESEPTRPAADLGGGERVGGREDVDGILRMLEREGIFEAPAGPPTQWVSRKEARPERTRVGRVMAVAWVLVLLLAVGGWFGWQKWIEHRHGESSRLVEVATGAALEGDHAALVDAERNLRVARDLNPHDGAGPETMIFVHAQRALEDGAFEPGYLRPAIQRGQRMQVDPGRVAAGEAVLAAAEGNMDTARGRLEKALEASPEDAAVLYMAGRVKQRLGQDDALERLEGAMERAPALSAAAIALAEARADEGRRDEAIALLDQVLARHPEHLRATLWREFVTADEAEPDRALEKLGSLGERLERGAPTDRVLSELTRARLQRRRGDLAGAAEAVDRAGEAGATEPRLLALVASEARSVGRLSLAQATASNAVAGAPSNPDFRKLLAGVLIERRDGVRALRTLGAMSMDDPEVLRMSAEAALLVGTREALEAAVEALGSHLEETEEPSVEMRALHVRALVAVGRGAEVLAEAQRLASDAPGDPLAALALGEAALAARQGTIAREALQRLVQAAPDDAEGHYLLGRAQRLAAEPEEAERSFRRAVELLPEHTEARLALGRLLLDRGKHAEADQLYTELARQSGIAGGASTALLGRLGRVEALIGLARIEDAAVQMESLRPQDRESPMARVATGQLALARSQPGEAVAALRPLAEAEAPPPDVIALFGDALFAAGEVEAANAQYDRALEKDRGLPEALLGKAQIAVRAERFRDAREHLAAVEESLGYRIRPPRLRAQMLLLRGRAALQEGRTAREAARSALRRAVQLQNVPVEAWFWLGEALSGENAPEAREAYQRYLELAPEGPYAGRARRAIR